MTIREGLERSDSRGTAKCSAIAPTHRKPRPKIAPYSIAILIAFAGIALFVYKQETASVTQIAVVPVASTTTPGITNSGPFLIPSDFQPLLSAGTNGELWLAGLSNGEYQVIHRSYLDTAEVWTRIPVEGDVVGLAADPAGAWILTLPLEGHLAPSGLSRLANEGGGATLVRESAVPGSIAYHDGHLWISQRGHLVSVDVGSNHIVLDRSIDIDRLLVVGSNGVYLRPYYAPSVYRIDEVSGDRTLQFNLPNTASIDAIGIAGRIAIGSGSQVTLYDPSGGVVHATSVDGQILDIGPISESFFVSTTKHVYYMNPASWQGVAVSDVRGERPFVISGGLVDFVCSSTRCDATHFE